MPVDRAPPAWRYVPRPQYHAMRPLPTRLPRIRYVGAGRTRRTLAGHIIILSRRMLWAACLVLMCLLTACGAWKVEP
jgi:hypothetical protein